MKIGKSSIVELDIDTTGHKATCLCDGPKAQDDLHCYGSGNESSTDNVRRAAEQFCKNIDRRTIGPRRIIQGHYWLDQVAGIALTVEFGWERNESLILWYQHCWSVLQRITDRCSKRKNNMLVTKGGEGDFMYGNIKYWGRADPQSLYTGRK